MPAYRTEVTIAEDGTLLINDLPFQAGDRVEVLVRTREIRLDPTNPYPLRGRTVHYLDPFESVAEDAWDALS